MIAVFYKLFVEKDSTPILVLIRGENNRSWMTIENDDQSSMYNALLTMDTDKLSNNIRYCSVNLTTANNVRNLKTGVMWSSCTLSHYSITVLNKYQ